ILLRGLALCGQSMAMGGVFFAVLVLRPTLPDERQGRGLTRTRWLIAMGAAIVIAAQALSLLVQLGALVDDSGWPLGAIAATGYFRASLLKVVLGLLMSGVALALGRGRPRAGWTILVALTALLALATAWTSHAAARLDHRAALFALDALHQMAAAAWVGGLI